MSGILWLDRKIDLALEFTSGGVDRRQADDIFMDICDMFYETMEMKSFSKKDCQERSKKLLVISSRLKQYIFGKYLQDLKDMEDALLTVVTGK